jgi:hypothetical protein
VIFGDRITPRYILRGYPGLDSVEGYVQEKGWSLISEAKEDQAHGVKHQVVWLTSTTITLHYEEDYISRQSYVYLAGDDFDALPMLVADLTESLQPWSRTELLKAIRAARTGPELARAVLRAGLGAPMEFDQEFFDAISACMLADEIPLREAGILAAGASPWPQFRPALERIAAEDPETEVREMAQAALRAFDKFRIGEQ